MRKVKGVFLENLELNDFPVDVQVKQDESNSGKISIKIILFLFRI